MRKTLFVIFLFVSITQLSAQEISAHVRLDSGNINRVGIISESGSEIVPVIYDNIFSDKGYHFVKSNGSWGCYNSTGKNFIPVEYEAIGLRINDTLIRVKKYGKWGFVNFENKTVIDFKYDFACNFQKNEAYVMVGLSKFYINRSGKFLRQAKREETYCPEDFSPAVIVENQFKDSILAIRRIGNKYGVVDIKSDSIVIPVKYDEIGMYFHSTILARKGKKWGAYTDKGKLITEPKYSSIGIFWED